MKEEKMMFSIYVSKNDLNFLNAYCKGWKQPLNGFIGKLISDKVIDLKKEIVENEIRLNTIKSELKNKE